MELEHVTLKLYGKECEFNVSFYDEDNILPAQWQTLSRFLCCAEDLMKTAEEPLRQFCLEANQDWFYNCGNEQDMTEEDRQGKLTDVFRVIEPVELFVDSPEEYDSPDERVVALAFDHRFNEDARVMVVFQDEQLREVCWDWEFA